MGYENIHVRNFWVRTNYVKKNAAQQKFGYEKKMGKNIVGTKKIMVLKFCVRNKIGTKNCA